MAKGIEPWLAQVRQQAKRRAALIETAKQQGILATPAPGYGGAHKVCLDLDELEKILRLLSHLPEASK